MTYLDFDELTKRSQLIREKYRELELEHHGTPWSTEEDALAFLTDAALIGRLVMADQNRWPRDGTEPDELKHKLGEAVWWLTVLANRMGLDVEDAVLHFLGKTENLLGIQ